MRYKAIIFDFFDVIHSDPYREWLRLHGLKDEGRQAEVNKAVDLDRITMQEHYVRLGEVTGQSGREVETEFAGASRVDYEVISLIAELKQQFTIALVSNSPSEYLREIIAEYDLDKYLDHVVISGEVGFSKPSPEIFQHALERLQTTPEKAIFIDDNPDNVAAAEQLGITSICHTDAHSLRQSLISLGVSVEV